MGLEVTEANGMLTLHLARRRKRDRVSEGQPRAATFTVLNFPVADIDRAVDQLTAAGVRFER